ncbi:hypothetical protein V2J09_012884 [Rumex salicifolius]
MVAMTCFPHLFGRTAGSETDEEVSGIEGIVKIFKYKELRSATNNFHPDNKIGRGGFGSVYQGKLKNGKMAAIKVLSIESKQGVTEFLTEIKAIACIQHENLVKLYGCCYEKNHRILVCRFLKIALLCTQDNPKLRPSMGSVVKMLTGEISIGKEKIQKPGLVSDLMELKVCDAPQADEKQRMKPETNLTMSSSLENMEDSGCAEMKMMVEGKTCDEDYPWVKVNCKGDEVDQPCTDECQSRHGPTARAWCKYDRVGWNVPWCACLYYC